MIRAGIFAAVLSIPPIHAAHAEDARSYAPPGDRQRVAVAVSPAWQDSLVLLQAELEELGLEVVEVPFDQVPTGSRPTPLLETPEQFRVVLLPGHVEVWIFDRASNVTLREVFAASDGTPLDSRTAALHAVELVRWQLRKGEAKAKPRRAPTIRPSASAPASASAAPAVREAWHFSIVPQALYSPGGTSWGAGAQVDVMWRATRYGLRLFGSSAIAPNELRSSAGSVEINARLVGLQAVLLSNATPALPGLEGSLGVGLAFVTTHLRGVASGGYVAHDDELLTIGPVLDVRGGYAVTRSLALVLSSSIVRPLRSSSLRVGNAEAGRFGEALITFGVGVQLTAF